MTRPKLLKAFMAVAILFCHLTPSVADSFVGERTDFRDETIYFMVTTRFYDGDPSNNTMCWDNQTANAGDPCWRGDFKGIIEKLDYIKALGFTAIWVTPIVENASGYDYHGYHARDISKVDRRYESEDADFQTLIDKAHEKGIKIILDIVLNHTGNFGEANLCPQFTRDWSANQADINACMKPNTGMLGDDYLTLPDAQQYARRLNLMKNNDGVNHDTHNYWHHYGSFNWDDNTRYWAQIAGDCVDLNTENPNVYNYLVRCYGEFIKMGVDGFRIDTSGHIARLTFNRAFIPQFAALGEQYRHKRLNQAPFYMFGEVCARYSQVTYRNRPALSPYFYTWQSPAKYAWSDDASAWDNAFITEQGRQDVLFEQTNPKSCEQEYRDNCTEGGQPTSDNAFLKGNDYHKPDVSNASGFNVIDFPMHYNYNTAGNAVSIAKEGDHLYNDATWNVVYVDSHDYGPQPNDQNRFNGGTAQWAENLTMMFTFRGIPCIYYGSEIEFRAGAKIDNGANGPLSATGRAYYGGYITGDVTATDFGEYTANGNADATLSDDLAQHIIRLNKIRAAVPALRKGQYSWEGCSSNGGYAFKRRFTDGNTDSYALVAINSGATFTGVLNGTYRDVVTGKTITVTDGKLVTDSFSSKGNLRVYVLNGTGRIIEDGRFIYGVSPASIEGTKNYDGKQEAATDQYQSADGSSPSVDLGQLEVYTPEKGDNELCCFYEAEGNVAAVAVWVWNATANFTGGAWDSKPAMKLMGKTEDGTRKIFKWTFEGKATSVPEKVIFVPSNDKQTADLLFRNGGYYKQGAAGLEPDHLIGDGTFTPEESDDRPVEGDICAYFLAPAAWQKVYCWAWSANANYTGGTWPGEPCTVAETLGSGEVKWKWTYGGSLTVAPANIIFSNGSGTQTRDLTFVNGACYDINGGMTTGLTALEASGNGILKIYSADGRLLRSYASCTNALESLPKGVYIINGKKIVK